MDKEIKVLTCKPDGSQTVETKTVDESYFPAPTPEPVDTEAVIMETLLDQELRIAALELGV